MNQAEKDKLLYEDLSEEKIKLIKKHHLFSDKNNIWISDKENSFPHKIFKHSFAVKNDIIGLLFRIYGLCSAKVKYFRQNRAKFEAYKYDYKKGFINTEIWDAEYFKHISSGYLIDLRYLQTITNIDNFIEFCKMLESHENNPD